jgi:hypothetical protein
MTESPRASLVRDVGIAFLWALIIASIIFAPGVFTRSIEFVYTFF